jgi:hypothetical protein
MNEERRARRGIKHLPDEVKRGLCVSVRVNESELAQLDYRRGLVNMQRGEYLRVAAIDQLPPTIPEVNLLAWRELSRSAANLNQIAKHLNQGGDLEIEDIKNELSAFRQFLIGALISAFDKNDPPESEGENER